MDRPQARKRITSLAKLPVNMVRLLRRRGRRSHIASREPDKQESLTGCCFPSCKGSCTRAPGQRRSRLSDEPSARVNKWSLRRRRARVHSAGLHSFDLEPSRFDLCQPEGFRGPVDVELASAPPIRLLATGQVDAIVGGACSLVFAGLVERVCCLQVRKVLPASLPTTTIPLPGLAGPNSRPSAPVSNNPQPAREQLAQEAPPAPVMRLVALKVAPMRRSSAQQEEGRPSPAGRPASRRKCAR